MLYFSYNYSFYNCMMNPLVVAREKMSGLMWTFISVGIAMLILAVLIVWTDVAIKLLFGLIVLLLAYCLFYAAYKIHTLRKLID